MHRLTIQNTWNGHPVPEADWITIDLVGGESGIRIRIDAPHWASPSPPSAPVGSVDGLWEYEVVEVFIAGMDERYTEIEMAPGGHHLVLTLDGIRQPTASGLPLQFSATCADGRWQGEAFLPWSLLPTAPHRVNATAIHGVGTHRRYLSWQALAGDTPDFHQLDRFKPLQLR